MAYYGLLMCIIYFFNLSLLMTMIMTFASYSIGYFINIAKDMNLSVIQKLFDGNGRIFICIYYFLFGTLIFYFFHYIDLRIKTCLSLTNKFYVYLCGIIVLSSIFIFLIISSIKNLLMLFIPLIFTILLLFFSNYMISTRMYVKYFRIISRTNYYIHLYVYMLLYWMKGFIKGWNVFASVTLTCLIIGTSFFLIKQLGEENNAV